ncbi:SH3 domain protein [Ancylostoma ceylanicum]|uniref:SH3 domain protein n=1 Tax=Ancylostoma ceylanicum TaxID=53326 RepID=A0A0D6M0W7_9BILA|nr:SH3 domain protein [Ancylostoma ceylanicum]
MTWSFQIGKSVRLSLDGTENTSRLVDEMSHHNATFVLVVVSLAGGGITSVIDRRRHIGQKCVGRDNRYILDDLRGDIMVGNVKSLVDRLSKDFSASRPPLSIHESRKPMVPKPNPHLQHVITTFAYSAAQDDELTLELGDIIEVLEEVEDGWSRGRQLRTGLVGMFPTNFVKPDVPSTATSVREEDKVVIRHTNDADLPEANRRTPSIIGGSSALGSKISHVETKDEPRTKVGSDELTENAQSQRL